MKKYKLFFIALCVACYCQAQKSPITFHVSIKNFNGEIFTLKTDSENIEGIFLGDKTKKKPLIIFIQGSEPIPLYCSTNDTTYIPLVPHQLIEQKNIFNFIFLSKSGVPALADISGLDSKYYFIDKETKTIPKKYTQNNTLEFYCYAYSNLIKELSKYFNYSQLIVIGHSQGARVAAEISINPLINKIVYMSADPLGRIATRYDKEYSLFNERNDDKLTFYKSFFDSDKSDSIYMGETYKSWKSFSKPSIIALAKSKVPTLVVYGEMDKNCPNCYIFSFLPNYYKNIDIMSYKDFDHNYFDLKGKNNWNIVVNDVYKWIESH
jgi:esterase/lipase